MDFEYDRRRVRRRRAARRALAFATATALAGVTQLTFAAPLDEPFVGGLSFSGPTSGTLAAVYWNPAALGLTRGFQLMVSGTLRWTSVGATRTPFDPVTGMSGAAQTATASGLSHPASWPLGPGGFIGIASDLGGDRFTLAFATYMPAVQKLQYPLSPTGDEPTRYHALTVDLRNLALVPALAIRFGNELRVGVAPGFLFSTGHLAFAQDTGLDMGAAPEDPANAARYDIRSGHGLGDAKFSVTLGGGIYWKRRSVEIGLAYQSRPLGSDVPGVEVAGARSTVNLPPGAAGGIGAPVTCPGNHPERCVFGDISYRLPDAFIAGATWRLLPGLELTAMVRWLWLHLHDRIDVRLLGPTLDATGLPQHVVLYRGFKDVWDARARISYWWRERLRIGAALRLETSAVDARAVNPAAVDGFKLQPIVLAEIRIAKRFWLGAGYGMTYMPAVTVTNSAFDPGIAIACADAGGSLAAQACRDRLQGRARPSANGRYTSMTHELGITFTARF
jgi:long-subunit fatty acid transport protein